MQVWQLIEELQKVPEYMEVVLPYGVYDGKPVIKLVVIPHSMRVKLDG
jgi:hypothetical protein